MPDSLFTDPRLAALYDTFDGPRDDIPLYVGIADELCARRVLDVGCGTGEPAVALAATGRDVVGVDPAKASLDIARGKSGDVTWLDGGADTVSAQLPEFRADLAMMTGNVAQVFLTDKDWHEALSAIHSVLRTGGHLAFETRRPEARAWERWAHAPAVTRDVPAIGTVTGKLAVTDVDLPFVSFRHTYRFPDGSTLASDSTLRFRDHDEIGASLHSAGFDVTDVRDAPDRPGMEYVFLATADDTACT